MSSVGDLTVNITSDASGLTSGMTSARDQLNQTTTIIQRQEQTWLSFAGTVAQGAVSLVSGIMGYITAQRVGATAAIHAATSQVALATATANAAAAQATLAAATVNAAVAQAVATPATIALAGAEAIAIPPTLTLAGAMAFLLSPITLIVAVLALAVAAWMYFSGGADDAAESTDGAAKSIDDASVSLSNFAEIGRKAANNYVEQATAMDKVKLAVSKVSEKFSEIGTTLTQPFIDGKNAMLAYIPVWLGLDQKLEGAKSALDKVGDALGWVNSKAKDGIGGIQAWLYQWKTGASDAVAKQFIKDGEAITERAKQQQAAMAHQQAASVGMKLFGKMMDEATAAAKANTDAERIRGVTSIAGINAEIAAFKDRAILANDAAVKEMEAAKKRGAPKKDIDALNKADADRRKAEAGEGRVLMSQKEGIETGTIKPMGTEVLEAARRAYDELNIGHDAFVISELRANAVTLEQKASVEALIPQIERMNQAQKDLTAQNENIKSAGEAFKKMAEDSAALDAKGVDKITALKDEIDLLNGSATTAGIAMRQLADQGFNEEQVAEIGALTAELDKLKKKRDKPARDLPDLKASFAGSSEAAKIMLRGVGAKGGNEAQQIANRQLMVQQQLLAATKANKPPLTQTAVV